MVALLLLATTALVLPAVAAAKSSSSSSPAAPTSSSGNARPLRFSSPVQSYTVFDKGATTTTGSPRRRFLPRFRTGLAAERGAGEVLADERRRGVVDFGLDLDDDDDDDETGGWAEASAAADERRRKAAERRLEGAYDAAVGEFDERVAVAAAARKSQQPAAAVAKSSGSGYQFVGVVNDGRGGGGKRDRSDVTWYARRKPGKSRWNVRLVHVNRDAVLRDLFVKGKVDLYGKYVNEGLDEEAAAFAAADGSSPSGEDPDPPGMRPLIAGRYAVRERTWRTLWNFSPVRMLASPSGSFWRERRIEPGLYTDGDAVYESVYRYRDGRNGMKPVAKLSSFLSSNTLGYEEKMRVAERLKGGDGPDVVVEK